MKLLVDEATVKMVLEVLERVDAIERGMVTTSRHHYEAKEDTTKAIAALREALAEQPAQHDDNPHPDYCKGYAAGLEAGAISEKKSAQQEPVATLEDLEQEIYENTREFVSRNMMNWMLKRYYTSPPPPQRKPLTDKQFQAIKDSLFRQEGLDGEGWDLALKEAIEAAHGIKGNT